MPGIESEVAPRREDFLDPVTAQIASAHGKHARGKSNWLARSAWVGFLLLKAIVTLLAFGALAFVIGGGLSLTFGTGEDVGQWAVIAVFVSPFYFVPSIVAWHRSHVNTTAIIALNVLLGWTFVGWAVALVWALTRQERK